MTDDQLIDDLADYSSEVFSRPEIDRLIALARIGTAVKPRPISDAPRDGTVVLLIIWIELVMWIWKHKTGR